MARFTFRRLSRFFHSSKKLKSREILRRAAVEALESRLFLSAVVTGIAYKDANSSGAQDASEPGIPGATIFEDLNGTGSYQSNDPSTTTNTYGSFALTLPGGSGNSTVTLGVMAPAGQSGWLSTSASTVSVDIPDDSTTDQTVSGVNFGLLQFGSVAGNVFQDVTGSGSPGYGAVGLSNWVVYYTPGNQNFNSGSDPSTYTGSDGTFYLPNVPDGDGQIHLQLPAGMGWQQTSPANGAGAAVSFTGAINFGAYDTAATAAPTGLAATVVSTGEIDLAWTNNNASNSSVTVLRSLDGGSTFSTLATLSGYATSYQDSSLSSGMPLSPGANYQYEIINQSSDPTPIISPPSAAVSAWTQPLTPTNLVAAGGYGNTVYLSWDASSMYGGYGNGDVIFRTDANGNTTSIPISSSVDQYTLTGLQDATNYTFTIASTITTANTDGSHSTSAPSTPAYATTGPEAPTGLTAVAAGSGAAVNLTWSSVAAPIAIQITRASSTGVSTTTMLTSDQSASGTYTDPHIPAGDVTLTYSLYAFYGSAMSASGSNQASVTFSPEPPGIAVGQTIEEDLNLGGAVQPGDTVYVSDNGYNGLTTASPFTVAPLTGAPSYYQNMPGTNQIGFPLSVDANGLADVLVTGGCTGAGDITVLTQSGGLLVDVPQSIFVPTLVVSSPTDATKNGADGEFEFTLLDPNGNPFVTPSSIDVPYTLSGTGVSGRNYTVLGTITIPAGQSGTQVAVHAIDDGLIDSTTVTLTPTGSGSSAYAVSSSNGSAVCNILDGGANVNTLSDPSVTILINETASISIAVAGSFTSIDPVSFTCDLGTISNLNYTLTSSGETVTATFLGVTAGQDSIAVTDPHGNSATGTAIVDPGPLPTAPVITATPNGSTEIDLAITSDSRATFMEIDCDGNLIYSGTPISSLPDNGLAPGTTYNFTITTSTPYNNGSVSGSGSTSACTDLSHPVVTATASCETISEIDLAVSYDSNATSMQVFRDSTLIYSGAPTGTLSDTGLAANTTYSYEVTTSNSSSTCNGWSNATTKRYQAPFHVVLSAGVQNVCTEGQGQNMTATVYDDLNTIVTQKTLKLTCTGEGNLIVNGDELPAGGISLTTNDAGTISFNLLGDKYHIPSAEGTTLTAVVTGRDDNIPAACNVFVVTPTLTFSADTLRVKWNRTPSCTVTAVDPTNGDAPLANLRLSLTFTTGLVAVPADVDYFVVTDDHGLATFTLQEYAGGNQYHTDTLKIEDDGQVDPIDFIAQSIAIYDPDPVH